MKYQKRLHWDRHRPEFLKVGFIFALAIAFMAFNYTSSPPVIEPYDLEPLQLDEISIPPTTIHKQKALPPPLPEKINIVEVEPSSEPIIEFTEKEEYQETKEVSIDENIHETAIEPAPIVNPIIQDELEEEPPFVLAERMPVYADCTIDGDENERRDCTTKQLMNHTYSLVKYPALARENEIEGTVVVSFIVNKQGNVEDIKIVRDIGMGCGDEVCRAIKKLGKFHPGKQNGRPVAVLYRFPVKFSLH